MHVAIRACRIKATAPPSYLPLSPVKVSYGVDQGVGPQDDARALGPLCAHQVVLTQQDFPYVFCTRDPDQRLP